MAKSFHFILQKDGWVFLLSIVERGTVLLPVYYLKLSWPNSGRLASLVVWKQSDWALAWYVNSSIIWFAPWYCSFWLRHLDTAWWTKCDTFSPAEYEFEYNPFCMGDIGNCLFSQKEKGDCLCYIACLYVNAVY